MYEQDDGSAVGTRRFGSIAEQERDESGFAANWRLIFLGLTIVALLQMLWEPQGVLMAAVQWVLYALPLCYGLWVAARFIKTLAAENQED